MSGPSPQLPLGIALRDNATLDGFVAGANAEALAALRALDGGRRIYLHGAAGTGKTHLLQAVCRAAGHKAAYLPLADLAAQSPAVLDGLEGLTPVCLDEVEAVAGDRDWEETLVGFLDRLRAHNASVIVAARRPADRLDLRLPDLASRLGWGTVYALQPLDDAGKARLLRERARARGLDMSPEVASFVIRRAPRDVPALLALLDRLDRASLVAKRRLTVPFVKQVLD